MMGRTKKHGWLKRERAKYPIRCRVKNIADRVYFSGMVGTVVGYGFAHDQTPTLHIIFDNQEEVPQFSGLIVVDGDRKIVTGQPHSWYQVMEE